MKEEVLNFLEAHREDYVSGQDLADQLGVSRAAVWKAIETLRSQGYTIEAKPKKGYRLLGDFDRLSQGGIRKYLPEALKDRQIFIYDSLDSTNTEMKRKLEKNQVRPFDVVLAEEQVQGRGRRGKVFASPKHTGLYMTLLYYKEGEGDLEDQDLITIKAALAVLRAVKKTTGLEAKIKWVNDLFFANKKFCGILTEGEFNLENREISAIYTGIGINIRMPEEGFGPDLEKIATALNVDLLRNDLAGEIISQLYFLKDQDRREVIRAYKEASLVLGRKISFNYQGQDLVGRAKDINDQGHLLVDLSGQTLTLKAGEISIRGDFS
ncbi:MAG: biotin--[acetyl-CoA-carboxylase] ligase [Peptoniphilus sp. oral taxon 375]|nr:biotin--[acetyl-CoA-carboxylase] ligase [Peptoniphilus sp. oral taxon 375]